MSILQYSDLCLSLTSELLIQRNKIAQVHYTCIKPYRGITGESSFAAGYLCLAVVVYKKAMVYSLAM